MTDSDGHALGTTSEHQSPRAALGLVLHVPDVAEASALYRQLGFTQEAAFPRADGALTLAILAFGSSTLLLGRRDELHYENPARARRIRRGPHGLGVVISLTVPDLAAVYAAAQAAGVEVLLEPVDEFYGDRVFMFLDPYGFEWKISQTIAQVSGDDVAAIIGST
jgi:uncharacterized glyoxalase superfamily protein PhnB